MRFIWILIVLASCSGPSVEYVSLEMNGSIPSDQEAESMILPYRDSLDLTMNSVLVNNRIDLTRGIPESTLGNCIADLLFERAQLEMSDDAVPDFCLINIGGLRVDLPEGDITIGKVFELMPFENELDIIKLSPEKMQEMFVYLKEKGGQPIAGMHLKISDGDFECTINGESFDNTRSYYVVTSDYLADGGDKMDFFKEPLERIRTGIKIRDAIIDHFRIIGLAGNSLTSEMDGRLTIE